MKLNLKKCWHSTVFGVGPQLSFPPAVECKSGTPLLCKNSSMRLKIWAHQVVGSVSLFLPSSWRYSTLPSPRFSDTYSLMVALTMFRKRSLRDYYALPSSKQSSSSLLLLEFSVWFWESLPVSLLNTTHRRPGLASARVWTITRPSPKINSQKWRLCTLGRSSRSRWAL